MTTKSKRKAGLAVLLSLVIIACFAMFMLTACGEDLGTIELDRQEIVLYEGADDTLVATTSKEDVTITWESSDKTIATVTNKGKVTARKAGTATITASLSDTVKAECTVTVKADDRTVTITGAPTEAVDVQTTTTAKLSATVSDGTSAVSWSSSNTSVASIDSEGNIKFNKSTTKSAEVTFTATIVGGTASNSVTVTVNNNYPDDYAVLEKNSTKANLIDDPDKWTYFIKSAHAGRLENADQYCGGNTPYYANGKVTFEFTSADAGTDEDTTQYEFRYQPGAKAPGAALVKGDVYTVTFKVETTVAGWIHVVRGGAGRLAELEYKDGVNYEGEYNFDVEAGVTEVTVEGCVVDDTSDPLAIRPYIFGDNVVVSVYDVTFEKTGHEDSIGGNEAANPDSYTLKKANNNKVGEGASVNKGQWSYYLSKNGVEAGCALKTGTYDADTKTAVVTYTNFSAGNVRLYYMPKEAEGTEIKISFKIAMNVDGTIKIGDAATHDDVVLTANQAQEVELTLTVGQIAVLLNPSLTNADDNAEVTFTISEFTVTAA